MNKVIVEPASDQSKEELVARYKRILQRYINQRPSGARIKIAEELNKNKSFVTQITNPSYTIPVPARHLNVIFDICHFTAKERETFLKAYTVAHPNYQYRVVKPASIPNQGRRTLSIEVPVLENSVKQKQIESMIKEYAHQLFQLVSSNV
ncbi:MAG: hypothetical protein KJP23_14500 [Deltaproteobacteria bacterium]|nr:hypothetical protein [Deltaproteobacteria bacterium]